MVSLHNMLNSIIFNLLLNSLTRNQKLITRARFAHWFKTHKNPLMPVKADEASNIV